LDKKLNFREFVRIFDNPHSILPLVLLVSTDLVFIILSSLGVLTKYFSSYNFSILMDGSYPEIFQYLKWFLIILLLILMIKKSKSFSYLAMAAVYFYCLLDDSLNFHEKLGTLIVTNLDFTAPFSMSPQDCGEFLISAISGLILIPAVIIAYYLGNKVYRKISRDLILLFLLLIFFGYFLDIFKHLFELGPKTHLFLSYLEDSGEMFIASFTLWYVYMISVNNLKDSPSIIDFLRGKLRNQTQSNNRVL
jgi:hypothetical protein